LITPALSAAPPSRSPALSIVEPSIISNADLPRQLALVRSGGCIGTKNETAPSQKRTANNSEHRISNWS
jgi:hypothetical protein